MLSISKYLLSYYFKNCRHTIFPYTDSLLFCFANLLFPNQIWGNRRLHLRNLIICLKNPKFHILG